MSDIGYFIKVLVFIVLCAEPTRLQDIEKLNEPKYLLITPSQLISGASNRVCISRFGAATSGNAFAQLELLTDLDHNDRNTRKYIARSRKNFPAGNGGCFDMLVPKTSHRKALLHLKIRFDTLPNYKINSKREIRLQHDSNIFIVQTDKPLYRAGENVHFRVLQLKPDLTPLQMPIYRISIEAPPQIFGGPVKVVRWTNVTTQLGVIEREYQLDRYSQQGEWRIVVESRDASVASTVKSFQVTDYMLPSFYLTIDYDKNILITFKQLIWTICARYMYGEGVHGKLDISVSSDSHDSQRVHFTTELRDSLGCFNHTVRTKLLGFTQEANNTAKLVIADVGFQEAGTRIWKNSTAVSYISSKVIKVEYVKTHKQYFKPGLPQKVKVRVTNWENFGVADAKVQFCKILNGQIDEVDNIQHSQVLYDSRSLNLHGNQSASNIPNALIDDCETGVTDARGYASFAFSISFDQNLEYIHLKTLVLDHPLKEFQPNRTEKQFAVATCILYSWGNVSKINMDIGPPLVGAQGLRPGFKQTFPVFLTLNSNEPLKPITLHYLLITRSGMLYRWGSSTQCPYPILDVQNMQTVFGPNFSDSECPEENFSESGVYKMMVTVKISHQMCPYSYLIVYFTQSDGEFVVSNKHYNVNDCFYNKVYQQWVPDTVAPSGAVKLRLRSTGPALCLLSVSNVALQHVIAETSVRDNVEKKLKSFIESRYNRTYGESMENVCFSNLDSAIKNESYRIFYDNTLKTFLSAGLEVITDLVPERADCKTDVAPDLSETPAAYSTRERYPKERSYFPETWLWQIRIMDANGSLDIDTTVPDEITKWESQAYCISRSGIATPINNQTGILKVYQPFFIELSTPKTMKRGEDVRMYYKIYNYMDQNLPVTIELEITPGAAATITSHETESIVNRVSCIEQGKSLVSHFTVKAHQLRTLNISVTAQIQNHMQLLCPQIKSISNLYDVRDKVVKEVLVVPEGVPIENHKSALLCVDDSTNKTEVSWTIERSDCVDESENWIVSLVGDISGPMAMNVDNLISLPIGCGEQNMAILSYNLIALEYSMTGKRVSGEMKDEALRNLLIGYQRQLHFRHSDTGAFSAFGPTDPEGSTWLTAFCVKYLYTLKQNWNIGSGNQIIEKATQWLLGLQMENGCFRNEGQVFHREMKGGLRSDTSDIALAAYVVISLVDADVTLLKSSIIQNVAYCLMALKFTQEEQQNNEEKMYTFALATLAQIKIEQFYIKTRDKNEVVSESKKIYKRGVSDDDFSSLMSIEDILPDESLLLEDIFADHFPGNITHKNHIDRDGRENAYLAGGASNALHLLKSMATRSGDMIWWQAGSLPVSIETTGYAMLSLLTIGGEENILQAMAAARWLSLHRTTKGGFISTQDTLIALQALCILRHSMPDSPPSLNVMIQGPGRGRHFTVNPTERHKLHTVLIKAVDKIEITPTKLKIKAEGKGCLLVQATQRYNTLAKTSASSPFKLLTKLTTDGTFHCISNSSWCMCAAVLEICTTWLEASGVSFPEMAILEVHLPTGYSFDRNLLFKLIKDDNVLLRRIEESEDYNTVYLYLSLSSQMSSLRPSECYNFYLIGPKSPTLPAAIKIYDYYHTDVYQATTYIIPETCPFDRNRIPHDEPTDIVMAGADQLDTLETDSQPSEFLSNFHVIDSDYDLEIPKSVEGVPPVYALPPDDFDKHPYDGSQNSPSGDMNMQNDSSQRKPFYNWTTIDSEVDLEVPEGIEANRPVWQSLDGKTRSKRAYSFGTNFIINHNHSDINADRYR